MTELIEDHELKKLGLSSKGIHVRTLAKRNGLRIYLGGDNQSFHTLQVVGAANSEGDRSFLKRLTVNKLSVRKYVHSLVKNYKLVDANIEVYGA